MAENSDDWNPEPKGSPKTTVQQPKRCTHLFQRKLEEQSVKCEHAQGCHRVLFCGRRRSKPAVHELLEATRSCENSECAKYIEELNGHLAVFRDHLMHVAKVQDSPEIRDRIRETRKKCLDLCVLVSETIMPQIRSDVTDGIPVDSQQLVNLVCCTQLFLRELKKCHNLVEANPMDMTAFYERRPRASGVAVLDKLVLWKLPPRDYHKEELQCISRDTEKISMLLSEMKEFMPCESNDKVLIDENMQKWSKRTKKGVYRVAEDWLCNCGSSLV